MKQLFMAYLFFFLRETTIGPSYVYGNVNKTSESIRSLINEIAFLNSSATTRE